METQIAPGLMKRKPHFYPAGIEAQIREAIGIVQDMGLTIKTGAWTDPFKGAVCPLGAVIYAAAPAPNHPNWARWDKKLFSQVACELLGIDRKWITYFEAGFERLEVGFEDELFDKIAQLGATLRQEFCPPAAPPVESTVEAVL